MSIKIYNGFILADKYNDGKISTLNKWCRIVKNYTKAKNEKLNVKLFGNLR